MDEGFNSYMNILSRAHRNGEEPNLDGVGQRYGSLSGSEDEAPMMWIANYAGNGYGYQTYRKAPAMLSMLGSIVGDKAVQSAMSDYTKVWSFKHPSPWDYIFFMDLVGHMNDRKIVAALEDVKAHTTYLRVLGSYPMDPSLGN